MGRRRRVSLRESFKIAAKAGLEADDPTGGGASLLATIAFGIWWWIAGVPVSKESGDDGGERHA